MLELQPGDPLIKAYLHDIQHLKSHSVKHELGLKGPFQNLLDKTAKRRGWTLVPELSAYSGGKRVVPDGTVRDEFKIARGWWEAKDTSDKLAAEIVKKLKAGYPTTNTIFEDTQVAVLYQDRAEAGEFALREPLKVASLLTRFLSHHEEDEREFKRAMEEFKSRIPDLARALREHIQDAHKNKKFTAAFTQFVKVCRESLNPNLSEDKIDEMLIQHLLTERLMRNLFQNPEFTKRNVIAAQVENVIDALAATSFSRAEFLKKLDPYYNAIERQGSQLGHFTDKQEFLNSVYQEFFQKFSPALADTHGIVYTPPEIVNYMCNSVERALKDEFGYTLASPQVLILDPCTGTGNFIVNLVGRIPGRALEEAYQNRLFANEVMLLPYYIASLNIEHAYYERMQQYEAFPGLCFVDTLDTAEPQQGELFTEENTRRVKRQKKAPITVVIGNPPYNVGQKSENDNNQNRKYKEIDQRVRDTYARDSKATNKNALSDMYVKFFRWASDRLGDRDGIVCFISNNSFVDQHALDGMRKHLSQDFQLIDHIDLHGNVRRNPKISGTSHNVFGIQVGVGITVAIKKQGSPQRLRYHRVPEMWHKREKLEFLETSPVPWEKLSPSTDGSWLVAEHAIEYGSHMPLAGIFATHSLGLTTARDAVVYDYHRNKLTSRIKEFIHLYNRQVDIFRRLGVTEFSNDIKWSSRLKECLIRKQHASFDDSKIRRAVYRPYCKQWVFLDSILNQRTGKWLVLSGNVIWIKTGADWPFFALMAGDVCDYLPQGGSQCFPLSHLKDSAVDQFRKHYADASISRENVFHYIYAILHHSEYRERYAANLKRELPRIPFAPNFQAFSDAGRELARLHVHYEDLEPWPLKEIESGKPFSQRVERMKLSQDRKSIRINDALTLDGIPEQTFDYRLGSRSALDWIIDQYQIKGESDPNREDDPGYIIRLAGQVIRVGVETTEIVNSLPKLRETEPRRRKPVRHQDGTDIANALKA